MKLEKIINIFLWPEPLLGPALDTITLRSYRWLGLKERSLKAWQKRQFLRRKSQALVFLLSKSLLIKFRNQFRVPRQTYIKRRLFLQGLMLIYRVCDLVAGFHPTERPHLLSGSKKILPFEVTHSVDDTDSLLYRVYTLHQAVCIEISWFLEVRRKANDSACIIFEEFGNS